MKTALTGIRPDNCTMFHEIHMLLKDQDVIMVTNSINVEKEKIRLIVTPGLPMTSLVARLSGIVLFY